MYPFLFADGTAITSTSTTTTTTITNTTTVVETDTCTTAAVTVTVASCDLDTSVDEISVENVPRREEGFFHRLLSRRSTKKKTATKSTSAEDVDVDRFLFDETMGAKPRQREEPPPAGRMQLSYPPDLPPDHQPHYGGQLSPTTAPSIEDIFESDTFAPIKQSFSLRMPTAVTDDDGISSGDGSSVQKSSSSDSVSSAALDEPVDVADRCRSYSSSDSEHLTNGGHMQRPLPVPAPRLSKLYNGGGGGGGGGTADVVVRRKKRDDQQPELFKVFARRSLKLGKDGEPELLLLADEDYGKEEDNSINNDCGDEAVTVAETDVTTVVAVDKLKNKRHGAEMDVNENQRPVAEVMPRFKRIQQRREEWEKRLLQQ